MKTIKDISDVKKLAETLSKCPEIAKYNQKGHDESWELALALDDMEKAFLKIYEDLVPKLLDNKDASDTMHDISEEVRHIDYHMRACKYFECLFEQKNP